MVRECNFSNETGNRAAGTISAGLYERKALDCTVPLPLIVTLNNLAYLVANNRKIRELLCEDGGLERLIRILREVPKNNGSYTRPLHNKDLQPMWKWTTAFQCIVHLCIRGGITVRERAVEAGIVPILVKVLESYLCFSDAMRAERKRIAEEKRQQRQGVETEEQRVERQQRARERERERREWERQASLIAAATANLGRRETVDTARRTPSRTATATVPTPPPTVAPAPARNPAAVTPERESRHAIVRESVAALEAQAHSPPQAAGSSPPAPSVATSHVALRPPTAPSSAALATGLGVIAATDAFASSAASDSAQSSSFASSSRASAPPSFAAASPARQMQDESSLTPRGLDAPFPGSQNELQQASTTLSRTEVTILSHSATEADDVNLDVADTLPSLAGHSTAPIVSVPPTAEATASRNASAEDLRLNGGWSGSEGAEEAEMSADGEDLDESEVERDLNGRDDRSERRREDAEERRTPRPSRRLLAPLLPSQQPTLALPEHTAEQGDGTTASMSARSDTVMPRADPVTSARGEHREDASHNHHHHHHGRDRHATVTNRSRPVLPTTYIAETFDPTDMAFREEEVLLSLQILAYLTKYPHIRALLRFPEMTRATNLHDLDVLWERAETSTGTPVWQPGSAFHRSIYTIAERYTCRATRRDPSAEFIAGTTKLAPLIQYWAGVVMRNACRKDDRENDPHSGLRQCGNMLCGKWETQPREFAKCRRCKKAKFCSKICQSTSWQIGHKYWCSSISDDSESSRARSNRAEEEQAASGATNGLGEAMPIVPLGQEHQVAATHFERDGTHIEDEHHLRHDGHTQREQTGPTDVAEEALAAPTPRQRHRGSSSVRAPHAHRSSSPNVGQGSSVPARIVSEAASINASDVSEDDETDNIRSRTIQTSEGDASENERGAHPTPVGGGGGVAFRFTAPPAPRRTDIAGRPLPPPVIAGTGLDLAGRQGIDDGNIGIGDSDDHFVGRFNAAVVEDQFGRGDIDQITWRGQTPTQEVQEAHGRHRPLHQSRQFFEPSISNGVVVQPTDHAEQGRDEYTTFPGAVLSSHPLTSSISQQPTLHAPVPHGGRRFPSMSIASGSGSEAAPPLSEAPFGAPRREDIATPTMPSGPSRRSVSGAIVSLSDAVNGDQSSSEGNGFAVRHLRSQDFGLHHHHSQGSHLNQHQHLLMRGGIAAGLMGRSATPTAYDLESQSSHGESGSSSISHLHNRPLSSALPLRPMMGPASAMSSPMGGQGATDAEDMANFIDEEATPPCERRDPLLDESFMTNGGSTRVGRAVDSERFNGLRSQHEEGGATASSATATASSTSLPQPYVASIDKRKEASPSASPHYPTAAAPRQRLEYTTSLLGHAAPSGLVCSSAGGSGNTAAYHPPSLSSPSSASAERMDMSPKTSTRGLNGRREEEEEESSAEDVMMLDE